MHSLYGCAFLSLLCKRVRPCDDARDPEKSVFREVASILVAFLPCSAKCRGFYFRPQAEIMHSRGMRKVVVRFLTAGSLNPRQPMQTSARDRNKVWSPATPAEVWSPGARL